MKVWGVSCTLDAKELLVVILELVEDASGAVQHAEVLRHRTNPGEDPAKKLANIQADVEATVKDTTATVAVVRAMDRSPFGRKQSTSEPRLQMEGVVLATLRREIPVVQARTGKEIGTDCEMSKDEVAEEARKRFGVERQEAGMAALAALRIAKKG